MATNLTAQLEDAVARGSPATLSLPSDGMFRDYRTRFLGTSSDGLWMAGILGEDPLVQQLIRLTEPCPVTFAAFGTVVQFKARLIRDETHHLLNDGIEVRALLLEHPSLIAAVQRRGAYRIRIDDCKDLAVTAWRITDAADLRSEPGPGTLLKFKVVDISATGLGGLGLFKPGEHSLATGQRVRVQLKWRVDPVLIGARVISVRPGSGECDRLIGIRFDDLQLTAEGRRTESLLSRILGELGRAEIQKRKGAA